MSLTFKMFLPVIIISVITIISMIIAKIVTDEDDWELGISLSALSYLQLSFR